MMKVGESTVAAYRGTESLVLMPVELKMLKRHGLVIVLSSDFPRDTRTRTHVVSH